MNTLYAYVLVRASDGPVSPEDIDSHYNLSSLFRDGHTAKVSALSDVLDIVRESYGDTEGVVCSDAGWIDGQFATTTTVTVQQNGQQVEEFKVVIWSRTVLDKRPRPVLR